MTTSTINPHIFRKYDIRGTFPTELNAQTSYLIGLAYGSYIKRFLEKDITVAVGHDVRTHSEALSEGLIKGLSETGIQVLDIGTCPTPVLYFANHLDETNYHNLLMLPKVNGSIMITGSHNPPEYNGFKMTINKRSLDEEDIKTIRELVINKEFSIEPPKEYIKLELNSTYREYIWSKFGLFKNLKVVVDSANGTAGLVVPVLLKKFGCEVIQLFTRPDGTFPFHHPDPTLPENMRLLTAVVQDNEADIGIGYDGDTDRLGVVTKTGKIIWGDDLMVIFAREIVKENSHRNPKDLKFIGEVKCSQRMYDFIEELGATAIMSRTGHSFIKTKMREEKAVLACEMSGHVFFADRYFGYDDAIYATIRLLEIISNYKSQRGYNFVLDELLNNLPSLVTTPEIRTQSSDAKKFEVMKKIAADIETLREEYDIIDVITIDGVRVIFKNGFALVRASNTEPILVTRFEAKSYNQLERYKSFIEELITKHNV
jgi:phosphomannomutase/phosphoglucomutase